jgi:diguanylate cyclase (GGDEF)-like protein/PAS domain S-box-containing protein
MGEDGAVTETSVTDLYRSLVDDSPLMLLAIRPDGTIVFASEAARSVVGRQKTDLVGTNVVDYLHPDDVERAVYQLSVSEGPGLTPGITRFRVAHADGTWLPLEVHAAYVGAGEERLIGVYARNGLHQVFLEDVMALLLNGASRAEALTTVCDVVQWSDVGSQIAISWADEAGDHQVSTGLPATLGGGDLGAVKRVEDNPWLRSRSNVASEQGTADDLDEQRATFAAELGLRSFWIEPVVWSSADSRPPALVTIWTQPDRSPQIHAYGMGVARSIVELILRWTEQTTQLDRAARLDPLTGLANRRAFFDALEATTTGGSILYCDLDRFKPVNDELGHAAGDQILRLVARRLEGCVRGIDLVARLGGDEFGVICGGASRAEAGAVAERIAAALQQPFPVSEQYVTISVSVGVASSSNRLDERLLEAADRALGGAKAGGRAAVRFAEPA